MKIIKEQLYQVFNSNKINLDFSNNVEGMLDPLQGKMLASLASLCPENEYIIEVGTFCGKSLSYLTQGADYGNCRNVLSIDGTARVETLKSNLEQLNKITKVKNEHIYDSACSVWEDLLKRDLKIGLFFYDAEHSIRAFFTILVMYSFMFAENTIIVVHDVHGIETGKVLRAFQWIFNINLDISFYEPEWYGKTGFLGIQYNIGNRYPAGKSFGNEDYQNTLKMIDSVSKNYFHDKVDENEP